MRRCFGLIAFLVTAALSAAQEAEEGRFDAAGVAIRYWTLGEGEPVVLIHGYLASADLWAMTDFADRLAENHEVVALDCRGHGQSGKPHGAEHYGAEMVEDLVRLLDHLQLERAHLVGYSMGGMLALKLATTEPERVISVVAGGAGWVRDFTMLEQVADSLEAGEGLGPLFASLTPEEEQTPEWMAATRAMEQQLLASNDPLAAAGAARATPRRSSCARGHMRALVLCWWILATGP